MVNAETSVYCILGNPVRHSFSPYMHNTAFQELNMNCVYTAFETNDIESAVKGVRALGIRGCSVTIPHKVGVIPFLDEVEKIASDIGSVNTVIRKQDKLIGTNTDAFGFYRALSEKTDIKDKNVALFGAGGAARAVSFALFHYDTPAKLRIFTLSEELPQNQSLARNVITKLGLNLDQIESHSLKDWTAFQNETDIIINATPLGMHPHEDSTILKPEQIKMGSTVMDLVYNPHETLLLKNTTARNGTCVYGIDMLFYQGIRQFELWTEKNPPIDAMRKALDEHLKR